MMIESMCVFESVDESDVVEVDDGLGKGAIGDSKSM
jgi:hypothetical protein